MSGTDVDTNQDTRQRVAVEVLELGQTLFDAVIEVATARPPEGNDSTSFPVDEVRAAADEFFTGMFETALAPDEIITKVSFPVVKKCGYEKFKHPASGFALVGVFVSKRGSEVRVAVTGAGANGAFRVPQFEEALKKRFAPKSLEGLSFPADGMNSDIHAGAEYRAHLVGVMARRATAKAAAQE